ncbi:MAG TPA: division/cell wall cluster transcriptional repressor MraZ [Solirubrobacteraceae bacterium]|nr:division/cell wall cluster transcriptional repressor MraZ [Solirubrobacteraceae bacterium]
MIFRGTFEHALDAKNRLTVPAKYRDVLKGGVVLAISPETEVGTARSLSIWCPDAYDSFVQLALADLNPLGPRARDLRNLLYGNSWDQELDAANRLVIPPPAREFAGLEKEVVITGAGDHLQLWDRAAFADYNAVALSRFSEITASFDHTH